MFSCFITSLNHLSSNPVLCFHGIPSDIISARGLILTLSIFFLNCLLLLSTFTTTTQVAVQAPRSLTGHYAGRAYNTTARQPGKVILDLYASDQIGRASCRERV